VGEKAAFSLMSLPDFEGDFGLPNAAAAVAVAVAVAAAPPPPCCDGSTSVAAASATGGGAPLLGVAEKAAATTASAAGSGGCVGDCTTSSCSVAGGLWSRLAVTSGDCGGCAGVGSAALIV
jgi:hypothetical protein